MLTKTMVIKSLDFNLILIVCRKELRIYEAQAKSSALRSIPL